MNVAYTATKQDLYMAWLQNTCYQDANVPLHVLRCCVISIFPHMI